MQTQLPHSQSKLPSLIQWQPLQRPISISQFKETSVSRSGLKNRYNPLSDPQLQVYLGKNQLKSKLQDMGYVFNPEKTEIVRRQVSKRKVFPSLNLKRQNNTRPVFKTISHYKTVSKVEFDSYMKQMKDKLKSKKKENK